MLVLLLQLWESSLQEPGDAALSSDMAFLYPMMRIVAQRLLHSCPAPQAETVLAATAQVLYVAVANGRCGMLPS